MYFKYQSNFPHQNNEIKKLFETKTLKLISRVAQLVQSIIISLPFIYTDLIFTITIYCKSLIKQKYKISTSEPIAMPTQDTQTKTKYINRQKSIINELQQQEMYSYIPRIYQQMFSIQSPDIKLFQAYQTVLFKLKKYKQAQASLLHATNLWRTQQKIWLLYMKYFQQRKQYSRVVQISRQARAIDQNMHRNTDLALYQIKTLHRLKQFDQAIQSINQYQTKYNEQFNKCEKLLHYKVYLEYQIGQYEAAYNDLSLIFKIITVSSRNYSYYQAQKCKFFILLQRYEQSLKYINTMLSSKDKIQQSFLLKVQALRSLCFIKLNKQKQALESIQKILADNQNDVMLQLKWVLIFILTLNVLNNAQDNIVTNSAYTLQSNHKNSDSNSNSNLIIKINEKNIKQRIKFVIIKMMEVQNVDKFTDHKFQQHFIQYEQLDRFRKHVQFLDQYLPQIQGNLNNFKKLAQNMFLSLLRGYYDCKKTHEIMLEIQQQIIMSIQTAKQNKTYK